MNATPPGIAGITPEQAETLQIQEIMGEVKMKAVIAYAQWLRKKHPTWDKEKILKKSAGLYNIKLV